MKLRSIVLVSIVFLSSFGLKGQKRDIQFHTEDIENFWEAFDQLNKARSLKDSVRIWFENYYLTASEGLIEYFKLRIHDPYSFAKSIRSKSEYYQSIRPITLSIQDKLGVLDQHFVKLSALLPGAKFPPVYFLMGKMNSAGTFSDAALYIGVEFYGQSPDTKLDGLTNWQRESVMDVAKIEDVVIHELVHYQQNYEETDNLLDQSIKEGSADFITQLVIGTHPNQEIHDWANLREKELWEEFKTKMSTRSFKGWLYDGDGAKGRPADLGYWMGYKICESYYNNSQDKMVAIREMLNIKDFKKFLEKSQYGKE